MALHMHGCLHISMRPMLFQACRTFLGPYSHIKVAIPVQAHEFNAQQ